MTFRSVLRNFRQTLQTWHHVRKWRRAFTRFDALPCAMDTPEPATARATTWGHGRPAAASIPPLIWMYWDSPRLPFFIDLCVQRIRHLHPDLQFHLLGPDSIDRHVGQLPSQLGQATVHQRADWIRLELLRRHGGIWLDASTLLTQPLDWVFETQAATQAEFVGFLIQQSQTHAAYPVVENWFMAAVPRSRFIEDWQQAFTEQVLNHGATAYLDTLRRQGRLADLAQAIPMPEYLTMHLCAQDIIQTEFRYRLALFPAEQGAFLFQQRSGWRRHELHRQLLARPAPSPLPPLIKLRSMDRKYLDAYLRHGLCRHDSIVGQLLQDASRETRRQPR